MRVAEYVHHDAVGLAKLVADGEVTVAGLQAAALEAAQAVHPQINAVVETWPADDGPGPAGAPLAGVPFLIKDIGAAMAGRRTELGSRLAAGNVARADSALMRRVRRCRTGDVRAYRDLGDGLQHHDGTRAPATTSTSRSSCSRGTGSASCSGSASAPPSAPASPSPPPSATARVRGPPRHPRPGRRPPTRRPRRGDAPGPGGRTGPGRPRWTAPGTPGPGGCSTAT